MWKTKRQSVQLKCTDWRIAILKSEITSSAKQDKNLGADACRFPDLRNLYRYSR